jgi:RND superfamily putative drug exporter
MFKRLLTFPAGRRAKWLVLIAWLVAIGGAMAADLPTKFSEAEDNESASFLPGDSESTKALEAVERLQGSEQVATVVVFHRAEGLTAADRRAIAQARERLNRIDYPQATDFGRPEYSQDGTTALLTNVIRTDGSSETILDPVDDYREALGTEEERDDGLQIKITGPAGLSADAISVFEGINTTLIMAAGSLVLLLLILIYRSPIFWMIPAIAIAFAELTSRSIGYGLTEIGVTVNGQTSSILSVLVLGAGTDYALLLVARYREELRRHADRHDAMRRALAGAGPAIVASGSTVGITLMALLLAKINGTSGLGPVGAMGIAVAMLSMLTLLPALLVIVGRVPFWPFIPHVGDQGVDTTHGLWRRIGERIARRPRPVWIGTVVALVVMALGLLNLSTDLTQANAFTSKVESIEGQELIAEAFPAGTSTPTEIVVRNPDRVQAVARSVSELDGVASVSPTGARGPDGVLLAATLTYDPFSTEAYDLIPRIREAARQGDPEALVGGQTAVERDVREAAAQDTRLLMPVTLVIVLTILIILLRSLVAPLLLVATVVVSFAAAMGASAVIYDVIFGFPGADASIPLYAFIFLVALGVDYNIFLMARVREESLRLGTRPGMLAGLAVTGGVITSAGIVLAGTFSVLAVLPLVFLVEIGFVVAFGVLLDTFVVRSVLVPALVLDIGPRVWWPSALARRSDATDKAGTAVEPARDQAAAAEAP